MTDLLAMQRLVQEVTRAWPTGIHVGDLAWWSREPDARVHVWRAGGRTVAWAWLAPPVDEYLVHPEHPELQDEVLSWLEAESAGRELELWALDADEAKVRGLETRGYARQPGPFFVHLVLGLDALAEPEVRPRYRLTHARDVEARVAVQRAAFTGSTTTVDKYARLRTTWPYTEELDVVVETDNRYVAFALAWLDDDSGIVELEPVGTHPDHGRRGLARAAILEALRRARKLGAVGAVVYARGDDEYPAPLRLYRSLGFEPCGRHDRYRRPS